jgi:cysteine dioxygenase
MPLLLDSVFDGLNRHPDRIPLEELRDWLNRAGIGFEDVKPYLRFHPDHYVRNLMYAGPAYQALILCWRNGQRSPIHDHQGSSCAVQVIRGQALETVFATAPNGMIFPVRTQTLEEGNITASQDADIHQMSNLQPDRADLITLHIYSPPLHRMNTYSLTKSEIAVFVDSINLEFVEGSGI